MFIGAVAGIVLALGVFGAVTWQRLDQLGSRAGMVRLDSQTSAAGATEPSVEKASTDERPVYRYSVIPGGVRTPEELLEAMANDSVVAAHHSGLDKAKLSSGSLNEPLKAHVSYRIGDRVYWTNRKVTIPAGEQVLTDGKTLVRARCGNGISVDPLLPALDNEPKPEAFDSIVPHVPANTVVALDPADSYLTPPGVNPPVPAGSGQAPFGRSSIGGGLPGPPPPGNPGTPGASSNPTSGDPPPAGVPPGNNPPVDPPVDPPKDPPGNPPGNPPGDDPPCGPAAATISSVGVSPAVSAACGGTPPGNPPGGNPPGGDPRTDLPPQDVPNAPTPVPEPGTLFLVAAGAAALLAHRVRRKKTLD